MRKAVIALVLGMYIGGNGWGASCAGEDLERGLKEVKGFLEAGLVAYQAGKIDEAEGNFSDAYFVAFEASGLETAIRQRISGKRAFQLERLFHQLRRMALERADARSLEAEVERTIREVSQEVARLKPGRSPAPHSPLRGLSLFACPLILMVAGLWLWGWWRRKGRKGARASIN